MNKKNTDLGSNSFDNYNAMATFLKVFGDETRLKILFILNNKEFTVTELCIYLKMSKSAISHQLRTLKDAKVVKSKKSGKNVFYSFDDYHVEQIMELAIEHINHKREEE